MEHFSLDAIKPVRIHRQIYSRYLGFPPVPFVRFVKQPITDSPIDFSNQHSDALMMIPLDEVDW